MGIVKAEVADSYTNQFRDLRAVLLSVCGKPVLQHYEKTTPANYHTVASVTKSIVGALVGIALADGALRGQNQTLAQLLPDRRSEMSADVAAITLRQLLTMTAGLDADSTDDSVRSWQDSRDFVGAILREGLQQPTGEFHYSTASSHLLAAILVHATGRPLLEYARARLFDPLAIETRPATQLRLGPASAASLAASAVAYDRAGFTWPVDPQGIHFGGGYLKVKPTDMLKLGQLYLDHGKAGNRQIVPAQWVQESTTAHVPTNGGFGGDGYGYQWWVTKAGAEDAYAAVGFGGQLIEVVPSRHLVAVFTTEVLLTGDHVFRVDARTYEAMIDRLLSGSTSPSPTGGPPSS
ncbi:serine hydrolase domain-containing protein [Terrabacter sp. BE26]|uniref:serine hydrolase domain-containing protein n=1 Tax=Terrabacter sp. BE26 TaxID=2898152 RepID=UPI0035BE1BCA